MVWLQLLRKHLATLKKYENKYSILGAKNIFNNISWNHCQKHSLATFREKLVCFWSILWLNWKSSFRGIILTCTLGGGSSTCDYYYRNR